MTVRRNSGPKGDDSAPADSVVGAVDDDQGDLAERAADYASELYADQEHESRRRRFERAVQEAGK
ncbi:MAG: hypothetical protein OEV43_09575 [Coriobacteriia bacterium]|nr:hypothetical protein [Coriobacteriia bacterium]